MQKGWGAAQNLGLAGISGPMGAQGIIPMTASGVYYSPPVTGSTTYSANVLMANNATNQFGHSN
jgi:hypothetical protein